MTKKSTRAIFARETRLNRKDWEEALRGGMEARWGMENTGLSNVPVWQTSFA